VVFLKFQGLTGIYSTQLHPLFMKQQMIGKDNLHPRNRSLLVYPKLHQPLVGCYSKIRIAFPIHHSE